MADSLLADLVIVVHFGFVLFAVLGGLLALRWPRCLWLHGPALLWAAWIQFAGTTCPLTPLENRLRRAGGEAGYESGFLDHYLVPMLYPPGLSRSTQVALGVLLLVANAAIYAWVLRAGARGRSDPK